LCQVVLWTVSPSFIMVTFLNAFLKSPQTCEHIKTCSNSLNPNENDWGPILQNNFVIVCNYFEFYYIRYTGKPEFIMWYHNAKIVITKFFSKCVRCFLHNELTWSPILGLLYVPLIETSLIDDTICCWVLRK